MWPGEQQPGGQQNPQWNPQGPPPAPTGGEQPDAQHPSGQPGFGPPPPVGPPPAGPPPAPPQQGYGQPQYGPPPAAQPPQYGRQPGYPPGYGYPQQAPPPQHGYGQPQYPQAPQQWATGGPGHPTMPPKDPGKGSRRTVVIAVAVAVVVIAAGVTAVVMTRGGKKTQAGPSTASSAPASSGTSTSPTPAPTATDPAPGTGGDGPRGSGNSVQPVVPGWQAVARGDRHVAYDVPAGWAVENPSEFIGFEDEKGNPAVTVGGAAEYKDGWCGQDSQLAATGSKGDKSAKSLQSAAENAAASVAYFGYNDLKHKAKGKLTYTKAKPFSNAQGIKGYLSTARETGVPKTSKCTTDGIAYVIAWQGTDNVLTEWVLWTSTGVTDALPAKTIETIESSIRQIP